MPSWKLILLLIPCIWNVYLFNSFAWLPNLLKSICQPLLKGSLQNSWEKICSQFFKNICEGTIASIYYAWFTILHIKFPGTKNFSTLSKLSQKLFEVSPLLIKYTRQNSQNFIDLTFIWYPYCSITFDNQPLGKRILHSFNM